jgi:7-keto-8-aminopelargonate synthetase-like enzyme
MYADFAPIRQLNTLMEMHGALWLYVDDAHSVSWTGRHGSGYALEHFSAIASANLHLSGAVIARQERFVRLIRLFNSLAAERGLPLASMSEAPIRYVAVGDDEATGVLARLLRDRGYFADLATYPAVPRSRSGIRISLTHHHAEADVKSVVETMAELVPKMSSRRWLAATDTG